MPFLVPPGQWRAEYTLFTKNAAGKRETIFAFHVYVFVSYIGASDW